MSKFLKAFKKRLSHHEEKEKQLSNPPDKPALHHTHSVEKLVVSDKATPIEKGSVANAAEDGKSHRRTPTISKPNVISSPTSTVRLGKPDKNMSNHDLEVCETVLAFMITHPEELSTHFTRYKKILGLASALTRTQDRAKSKPAASSTPAGQMHIVQSAPATPVPGTSSLMPPPAARHNRSSSTSAAAAAIGLTATAALGEPQTPNTPQTPTADGSALPSTSSTPVASISSTPAEPASPTSATAAAVSTAVPPTSSPAPVVASTPASIPAPVVIPARPNLTPVQRSRPPSLGGAHAAPSSPMPIPASPTSAPPTNSAPGSPVSNVQAQNLAQVSAAAAAAAANNPHGQTQLRASVLMRVKQILGDDFKATDSIVVADDGSASLTGTGSAQFSVHVPPQHTDMNVIDQHLQNLQHTPAPHSGALGEAIYPPEAVEDIVDVYFRSTHGAPISMVVGLSDTVASVKQRLKILADGTLAEAEEIDDEPASNKDLEYEGNYMEDDRTLADYDVFEFCAVRCLPRK